MVNNTKRTFEKKAEHQSIGIIADQSDYELKLYITGTTPSSSRAVVNIRKLCEEFLPGRYRLEVIDVALNPGRAKDDQIIAAPTLIRHSPLPLRRFIGDLSDRERLITRLELA